MERGNGQRVTMTGWDLTARRVHFGERRTYEVAYYEYTECGEVTYTEAVLVELTKGRRRGRTYNYREWQYRDNNDKFSGGIYQRRTAFGHPYMALVFSCDRIEGIFQG